MITLLIALQAAATDPCDSFKQGHMNECAAIRAERAEAELKEEIAGTLAWARDEQFTGEGIPGAPTSDARSFEEALQQSQLAFEDYRNAECSLAVYPHHGGSMAAMVEFNCRADLTEGRVKMLRNRRP